MSRYRGPRVKIIRRLGSLPGLTNKTFTRQEEKKPQDKKKSQYRVRLKEKQKLRFHYGLTERQLLRYVKIARKTKGSTGQTLLQLLEMRLDNIVFRLGMAPTIPAARQLVNHGHITVNQQVVDIPSYRCKRNDEIIPRDRVKSRNLVQNNLLFQKSQIKFKTPSFLTLQQQKAEVLQIVDRKSIGVKINELLIVEYYSRQA